MYYIWKEWKESIRGKGFWLAGIIIVVLSAALLFQSSVLSFDKGFYIVLINLFDAFIYVIPVLCLFLSAFSVYQEKEQKTLIMLLSKQESYFTFLVKKSLAIHVVLTGLILIWFFIYLVPLKFYFQPDLSAYLTFIFAVLCLMIVFIQIGAFIGSIGRSKIQIVGFTVLIWFYFFFLHDIVLLSLLPDVSYENVKLFSAAFFLNPIQAVRVYLESGLGVYTSGHMSKLFESFLWTKPAIFLTANLVIWLTISMAASVTMHRKEGYE
ncbi:copper ABC transporter permease [Bacillus sp. V3-13]|uniref:ABC transporter permease n=1 Tax=Bacillus sp. V3-13 TaxID=2053728 RepID=UPI000C78282F|nr:ABC transporter permease subunit [Bacillus sp. V3-13]PLR79027.1 copper ABC transporter permease [Bacillus sp. V3-13]